MESTSAKPLTRSFIGANASTLERGGKQCVREAKEHFGKWLWAFRNLPKEQYQAVCGLAMLVHWCQQAVAERKNVPRTEAPCDQLREDLSDAFTGRFVSAPIQFLAETVDHYRIPKQFVFEPLEAFDRMWRFGQPANESEMMATATRLGGALMRQLVHVLGIEKPDFEQAAMKLGQGLCLTWWLMGLPEDIRQDSVRLAKSDFDTCQLKPEKILWPEPVKELNHLVRLYWHRILRTLMGIGWKALSNARLDPQRLREPHGAFTEKDLFSLRARQFLGLDSPMPFGTDHEEHH
jgi:phytoene/squalene synthetase